MRLLLNILAVFVSFSAFSLRAETFSYRLNHYPTTMDKCDGIAKVLGERFASLSGNEVLQSGCEAGFGRLINIVITYGASEAVKRVTTVDEFGIDQGFYRSQEDCESNIRAETEQFKTQTGLQPLVAYCYLTFDLPDYMNPYVLNIEAVGVARLKPFTFGEHIYYGAPLESWSSIAEKIQLAAEGKGLVGPRVIVDRSGSLHRLILRYYGESKKPVALLQETSYPTAQECYARRAEVAELLATIEAEPLVMFCATKEFSDVTLLYTFTYLQGAHTKTALDGLYPTMEACDEDRERVLAWYRQNQELEVAGALCSFREDDFIRPQGIAMTVYFQR